MRNTIILLSFKQLSVFGVHIGHDYKNVFFYLLEFFMLDIKIFL